MEQLWTIKDVAKCLGVSESWVRDHITRARPLLPHFRVGKVVRFRECEIEKFIRDNGVAA